MGSRWDYYVNVLMPLQKPLLDMGNRGMLVDEAKVAKHKRNCKRRVAAATKVLVKAGEPMLVEKRALLQNMITELEIVRAQCKHEKEPFDRGAELTHLRTQLKTRSKPFNPDSAPQRAELLYSFYGLPPIKNKGAKGFTTDEDAVADLTSRIKRGTAKAKRVSEKQALLVLKALSYGKKYATLERTFLNPELR